mgnify:FL=1
MTHTAFAKLPDPPYYSVIFSSQRTPNEQGYNKMADRMLELATQQAGYLGVESVRGEDGFGITVSYWSDVDAIKQWRAHAEHRIAQETGKAQWYQHFEVRIARVERAYAKK